MRGSDMKLMLLAALVAAVGAHVVVERAANNACYRCSRWDATGQGFVETGDSCIAYYECWKVLGSGRIGAPIRRFCPIGTMVMNEDAIRGHPCTRCDPVACPECIRDYSSIEIRLECPYKQMIPEWDFGMGPDGSIQKVGSCGPGGYFNDTDGVCTCTEVGHLECPYVQLVPPADFGRMNDQGQLVKIGSCGVGGYFNDSEGICTCTVMGPGCTNRVNIPLAKNINDVSCHKNWVGQTGMPTIVHIGKNGPPDGAGGAGIFTGYDPDKDNAPHLTTYGMDGVFAGDWVFQVSFNVWFNVDISYGGVGSMGVVTLGDCVAGPSAHIWIVDGVVKAGLELFDQGSIDKYDLTGPGNLVPGDWYFASVTYDRDLPSGNLKLYVMDPVEYSACAADSDDCIAVDEVDAAGSVTPRGCGFSIGSTAEEATDGFFLGLIARVVLNMYVSIF